MFFFGLMLQAVYGNPPKRSLQACSVNAWQSFFFLFWVDSKEEITTSLTLCKGDGSWRGDAPFLSGVAHRAFTC